MLPAWIASFSKVVIGTPGRAEQAAQLEVVDAGIRRHRGVADGEPRVGTDEAA